MARRRRQDDREIEWDFFSFPVLFGFSLGAFIATLLYPLGQIVFVVSLFGVSFGVAHIFTHWLRRRSLDRARQRAEEEERERRALAARAEASRPSEPPPGRRRRRRRG